MGGVSAEGLSWRPGETRSKHFGDWIGFRTSETRSCPRKCGEIGEGTCRIYAIDMASPLCEDLLSDARSKRCCDYSVQHVPRCTTPYDGGFQKDFIFMNTKILASSLCAVFLTFVASEAFAQGYNSQRARQEREYRSLSQSTQRAFGTTGASRSGSNYQRPTTTPSRPSYNRR